MTIPYEDKTGALQSNKAGDVTLTQECTLRGRDGLAAAANEDRAVGVRGACKLLSLNSVLPLLRMAWSCDCGYIVSQPFRCSHLAAEEVEWDLSHGTVMRVAQIV